VHVQLRAKLEKAIAHYEAKNERQLVYASNPEYIYNGDEEGIFGADSEYTYVTYIHIYTTIYDV
jgi:hypothetical protein